MIESDIFLYFFGIMYVFDVEVLFWLENTMTVDFTYMALLIISGCKPRKDSRTPRSDAKSKSRDCDR